MNPKSQILRRGKEAKAPKNLAQQKDTAVASDTNLTPEPQRPVPPPLPRNTRAVGVVAAAGRPAARARTGALRIAPAETPHPGSSTGTTVKRILSAPTAAPLAAGDGAPPHGASPIPAALSAPPRVAATTAAAAVATLTATATTATAGTGAQSIPPARIMGGAVGTVAEAITIATRPPPLRRTPVARGATAGGAGIGDTGGVAPAAPAAAARRAPGDAAAIAVATALPAAPPAPPRDLPPAATTAPAVAISAAPASTAPSLPVPPPMALHARTRPATATHRPPCTEVVGQGRPLQVAQGSATP